MELWTLEHAQTILPALVVMIAIAAILRRTIGEKDLKIRMIPFQILACILFLLEVGKQIVSLSRGYDLYHLPFHFCSLFIFILPLTAFYKGKYAETLRAISAALCTAMTLFMVVYPNLIYSAGNINGFFKDYLSFHTVTFHNIVVFAFILTVALRLHNPAPKGDLKKIVLFMVAFCATAAVMSQVLKTNYANFYTCNIPVFESLRTAMQGVIGSGPTQLLYVLILTALHLGFVSMSYGLYRLLQNVTNPAKQATH